MARQARKLAVSGIYHVMVRGIGRQALFHTAADNLAFLSAVTFALQRTQVQLINNGIPLTAVSGRLGHADTATTTRVYSHMIQSAQAAAADKIQDILSGYNHH